MTTIEKKPPPRVEELRKWIFTRIEELRPYDASLIACGECRALKAMLRILDGE